jgi:inorganic pyrophosphatase
MGDHDPLDICVLSSHNIHAGGLLMEAIPIGGFKMIDGGEADDKIVAVMIKITLSDISEIFLNCLKQK